MSYHPEPINTEGIQLPRDIDQLIERLAEHAHDIWARRRFAEGWTHGSERNDMRKEHPCLVAYGELPESEKEYDRSAARETLRAILSLGYRIERVEPSAESGRGGGSA